MLATVLVMPLAHAEVATNPRVLANTYAKPYIVDPFGQRVEVTAFSFSVSLFRFLLFIFFSISFPFFSFPRRPVRPARRDDCVCFRLNPFFRFGSVRFGSFCRVRAPGGSPRIAIGPSPDLMLRDASWFGARRHVLARFVPPPYRPPFAPPPRAGSAIRAAAASGVPLASAPRRCGARSLAKADRPGGPRLLAATARLVPRARRDALPRLRRGGRVCGDRSNLVKYLDRAFPPAWRVSGQSASFWIDRIGPNVFSAAWHASG